MKYVIFENNGVIDLTALKTFGVSVKETENPIGFFGTGLKYSIAILLRESQEVQAYAGLNHLKFSVKKKDVRGKEFDIVQINDEDMPFTTKLGINWQMWQAFRELYCNTIDENGTIYLSDSLPTPEENKTFFIIEGSKIRNEYFNKDEIILSADKSLLLLDGEVQIYNRPSKSMYYRNVKVYDFEKPTLLTYNYIKDVTLTEDRTVKYFAYEFQKLPRAIVKLKKPSAIRKALLASEDNVESVFNYGNVSDTESITDEFMKVAAEEYHNNTDKFNSSARELFCKKQGKDSVKSMISDQLTEVEQMQFERAKEICRKLYADFDRFPVLVVRSLGETTMALADMERKLIVLSKPVFKSGTKYLVSTMLEEYIHLATGYWDCTRQMQTYLFDTICTITEEHILKEPI